MTKRIKNLGCLTIGILGMLGEIALINVPTLIWENERREVAKIADTNKDGFTDTSEWNSVYEEVGLKHYIPDRYVEGRNLSMPELEEYISSHSK